MGGYQVSGQTPGDDGFDEEGYDESQRAEILEATRDGPTDGTILTDLDPDLGDEPDKDDVEMSDADVGEEDDDADMDEPMARSGHRGGRGGALGFGYGAVVLGRTVRMRAERGDEKHDAEDQGRHTIPIYGGGGRPR